MPASLPTVYIVDDDVSVREALQALLRLEGLDVRAFESAAAFLANEDESEACCLILDIGLPDLNGLDVQSILAPRQAELPIIFITGSEDVPTSVRAMRAGAVEFLTKPFSDVVLLQAVRNALAVSRAGIARDAELKVLRKRYASLTGREREVMALVVAGLLNKQAAHELGLSEITVKVHRGRLMEKMHAASLPDLVKMAEQLGVGPGLGTALRGSSG